VLPRDRLVLGCLASDEFALACVALSQPGIVGFGQLGSSRFGELAGLGFSQLGGWLERLSVRRRLLSDRLLVGRSRLVGRLRVVLGGLRLGDRRRRLLGARSLVPRSWLVDRLELVLGCLGVARVGSCLGVCGRQFLGAGWLVGGCRVVRGLALGLGGLEVGQVRGLGFGGRRLLGPRRVLGRLGGVVGGDLFRGEGVVVERLGLRVGLRGRVGLGRRLGVLRRRARGDRGVGSGLGVGRLQQLRGGGLGERRRVGG
jgi:hypothetical protein